LQLPTAPRARGRREGKENFPDPPKDSPTRARAQAIKRRRQIWDALHPDEIQVEKVFPPESATGYKQPPPQEKGFAASTAAAAGMTKQAINQHLARAEALGDDLERIAGTIVKINWLYCALPCNPRAMARFCHTGK